MSWRGVVLLVAALDLGCATAHRPAPSPFVKGGKPAIEIGRPVARSGRSTGTRAPHRRVEYSPPPKQALAPTLESTDQKLAAALFALASAPSAAAHLNVAERYLELGVTDAAFDHFFEARRLDRTDAAAYEGLARLWRDWGFPQLGLPDASRAVYYAPSSPTAHNTLGTLLAAMGRGADARRSYERTIALDPQAAYAWNNLCHLSIAEGEPARAVDECRAALALDPGLGPARDNLARAARRLVDPVH